MATPSSIMPPWSISDIDFSKVDVDTVRDDDTLFFLLSSASMVESGSDVYTRNLVMYYGDNPTVSAWLSTQWEPEELQHGRALRAYVEHVWPEFDWQTAYDQFLAEYSLSCTVDEFEATQALELAARCVVEMGTSTLYRSILDYTREPVLRQLMDNIRSDEVRHYKYFYRYFREYNQIEGNSRMTVFGALFRRLMEIRNDDADCAIRHVLAVRERGAHDPHRLREVSAKTRQLIRQNLTVDMSVKMFLKPLGFPKFVQESIGYPLSKMTQYLFLR